MNELSGNAEDGKIAPSGGDYQILLNMVQHTHILNRGR